MKPEHLEVHRASDPGLREIEKRGVVVAIDGPAGAGKSTLGSALAARLGVPYVNTGLMYRALAREALDRGVDPHDEEALVELVAGIVFSVDDTPPKELLIAGRPPDDSLHSSRVDAVVSAVARHPSVRTAMRRWQRRLGAAGAVIEGRDIATVVFPDADVKIFLDASADERMERRTRERGATAHARRDVVERDARDTRTTPLVPAPGAVVVDSTRMSADEVIDEALRLVREAMRSKDSP